MVRSGYCAGELKKAKSTAESAKKLEPLAAQLMEVAQMLRGQPDDNGSVTGCCLLLTSCFSALK